MASYKREWHYQVFDTCDEFESWQIQCNYERNIQTIQVMDQCECGSAGGQKVLVTWWVTPPGSCEHQGTHKSSSQPSGIIPPDPES